MKMKDALVIYNALSPFLYTRLWYVRLSRIFCIFYEVCDTSFRCVIPNHNDHNVASLSVGSCSCVRPNSGKHDPIQAL